MPGLIVEPNGHQYTTAAEELRVRQLKQELVQRMREVMQELLARGRGGQKVNVNVSKCLAIVDQAYFLGRQDG